MAEIFRRKGNSEKHAMMTQIINQARGPYREKMKRQFQDKPAEFGKNKN